MDLAVFGSAFAVTFALTPAVAAGLRSAGRLDVPNARSSHTHAVPRGGGIACAAGCATGLVLARPDSAPLLYCVLGSLCLLTVIGHLDDRRSLSSWTRLLAQAAAGALCGVVLGPLWALGAATAFVVVVNCVNFMDGINGITSVTMLGWGVAAVYLAQGHDAPLLGVLGLVTSATSLAFLPWNAPQARIFLGDVGSYLFGAAAAAGFVMALHAGVPVLVALSPLMTYLFDVGLTLLRRLHRRASLFEAHREHIYQRLTAELPLSHAQVSAYVLTQNAVLICAWLLLPLPVATVLTVAVLGLYAASTRLGRHFVVDGRQERQRTS